MVRKPNSDDYRLCIDYRLVNSKSIPEAFPTMTLEEIWEIIGMHKPKYFTTLDMLCGFQQIAMDERTKHKSTFVVRSNQYQWLRMPMGLRNAPITFQKTMATVLKGLLYKTCLIYLDDIIVWSDCISCHKKNLQEIFDRLSEANLSLKASKCKFAMEEITYLGHVLDKNGVRPNPQKIEIIQNYKPPKNEKQLRQFLGLSQYYRRFQKNFSKIAKPLYDLTQKDTKWNWTPECQKAFETLKTNLITPPILAYPDVNKPFIITCDASTTGLGYILSQKDDLGFERVVEFSGRSLRNAEKNYTITELEALSVIAAFRKFHSYVYGNFVTVRTDHEALKYIHKNKNSKGRLIRWVLELLNYDYEIEHRPGIKNGAADALSRIEEFPKSTEQQPDIPGDAHVMSANTENPVGHQPSQNNGTSSKKYDWLEIQLFGDNLESEVTHDYCFDINTIDIVTEQQNCEEVGPWYQFIKTGEFPPGVEFTKAQLATADQYAIKDNILVHLFQPRTRNIHQYHPIITQIVVPKKLRARILSEFHESLVGGTHQAFDRTFQAIRQRFYWRRMYSDIYEYQKTCQKCQKASIHHPKRPPLKPLPVEGLFHRYQIDFLGPLRKSKCGKRWILLCVDAFSGWCEAFALENADAITTAKVLYSEIFTRYGSCRYLLSDRGANFLSSLVQALCDLFSVKRTKTSSYHPASNSKCEKFNSFINKSLRTLVDDSQQDWPSVLPGIMMAYRCTPSRSSEFSPYFLCFGKEMITPIETVINPDITEVSPNYRDTLKSFIDNIKLSRKIAHENILRHQQQYKEYYDRNSAEPNYKINDLVWLYDPTTPVGFSKKLKPRWKGPYRISQLGPNCTYRLRHYYTDLPTDTLINAPRIKPAHLPWESRIRRQDPDAQRGNPRAQRANLDAQRANIPGNNQDPPRNIGQNQPANQQDTSHKGKSGSGQYQNTKDSQIQKQPGTSDQPQTTNPLRVEKVVNVKHQGQIKWCQVKLNNVPGLRWYKLGDIPIPQHLLDDCLKVRTWDGKPRKKKKKWKLSLATKLVAMGVIVFHFIASIIIKCTDKLPDICLFPVEVFIWGDWKKIWNNYFIIFHFYIDFYYYYWYVPQLNFYYSYMYAQRLLFLTSSFISLQIWLPLCWRHILEVLHLVQARQIQSVYSILITYATTKPKVHQRINRVK